MTTDKQVKLIMEQIKLGNTQKVAAVKADVAVKTARKIRTYAKLFKIGLKLKIK